MASKVSSMFKAIIMGAPGSGKGTISQRIVKDFGMIHLSTGDVLRKQLLAKSEVGLLAERYMEHGALVPDDVMTRLMSDAMGEYDTADLLLDGFPRTLPQAEALTKLENVDIVIDLVVPFDILIQRISGRWIHAESGRVYHTEFNPPKVKGVDDVSGEPLTQRIDDQVETVMARLQSYQKQTYPVLEHYKELGIFKEFKGNYSNEIWPNVHKFLSGTKTPLQYTHYGNN